MKIASRATPEGLAGHGFSTTDLSYALFKASSFLSVTNCTEETW